LEISFHDLFYLLSIRLLWSHDPGLVFNGLTRVNSGSFCMFFLINFFQFYHLILDRLRIEFHILFWFIFFGISGLLIRITSFDILTLNKSDHFFVLSKRLSRFYVLLTLDLFFIGLFMSHALKLQVWQVNPADSIF
jgi:hypothetical protein